MVEGKMAKIQGNYKMSNVYTVEDLEREKQNNGKEVIFLSYNPTIFSINEK